PSARVNQGLGGGGELFQSRIFEDYRAEAAHDQLPATQQFRSALRGVGEKSEVTVGQVGDRIDGGPDDHAAAFRVKQVLEKLQPRQIARSIAHVEVEMVENHDVVLIGRFRRGILQTRSEVKVVSNRDACQWTSHDVTGLAQHERAGLD